MNIAETLMTFYEIGLSKDSEFTLYNGKKYYQKIFHYNLLKKFLINDLFLLDVDSFKNFNTIRLGDNNVTDFFIYINTAKGNSITFIDIPIEENMFHNTILIYNHKRKTLEHYDSSCECNIPIFLEFLEQIKQELPYIKFISSQESHLNITKKKSLNILSSNVKNEKYTSGMCQMWSLIMFYLVYKYNFIPLNEILDQIYTLLRNFNYPNRLHITHCQVILLKIVNGFLFYMIDNLKEFNITTKRLSEFNIENEEDNDFFESINDEIIEIIYSNW